jgi:hypothetical protein
MGAYHLSASGINPARAAGRWPPRRRLRPGFLRGGRRGKGARQRRETGSSWPRRNILWRSPGVGGPAPRVAASARSRKPRPGTSSAICGHRENKLDAFVQPAASGAASFKPVLIDEARCGRVSFDTADRGRSGQRRLALRRSQENTPETPAKEWRARSRPRPARAAPARRGSAAPFRG